MKRTACPSDRRSLYTVITQSGQQKLNAALPEHLRLIEEWFTGLLTPAALDGLLSGLRTVGLRRFSLGFGSNRPQSAYERT